MVITFHYSLYLFFCYIFPIKAYLQQSVCICTYVHVYMYNVYMCVHMSRSPKISISLNPAITVVIAHDLSMVLDPSDHSLPWNTLFPWIPRSHILQIFPSVPLVYLSSSLLYFFLPKTQSLDLSWIQLSWESFPVSWL